MKLNPIVYWLAASLVMWALIAWMVLSTLNLILN